jgi:hypothetical protein
VFEIIVIITWLFDVLIQSDSLEGARPFAQGFLEVFRVRSLKLLNQIQTAKPLEYPAPYMK